MKLSLVVIALAFVVVAHAQGEGEGSSYAPSAGSLPWWCDAAGDNSCTAMCMTGDVCCNGYCWTPANSWMNNGWNWAGNTWNAANQWVAPATNTWNNWGNTWANTWNAANQWVAPATNTWNNWGNTWNNWGNTWNNWGNTWNNWSWTPANDYTGCDTIGADPLAGTVTRTFASGVTADITIAAAASGSNAVTDANGNSLGSVAPQSGSFVAFTFTANDGTTETWTITKCQPNLHLAVNNQAGTADGSVATPVPVVAPATPAAGGLCPEINGNTTPAIAGTYTRTFASGGSRNDVVVSGCTAGSVCTVSVGGAAVGSVQPLSLTSFQFTDSASGNTESWTVVSCTLSGNANQYSINFAVNDQAGVAAGSLSN